MLRAHLTVSAAVALAFACSESTAPAKPVKSQDDPGAVAKRSNANTTSAQSSRPPAVQPVTVQAKPAKPPPVAPATPVQRAPAAAPAQRSPAKKAPARTIDQVKAKHSRRLLAKAGVIGVSVSRAAGKPVIRVFVANAAAAASVPSTLDGYRVVTEVTGTISAQ